MVAERFLDLRLPKFSPNPARSQTAMSTPAVADVFFDAPMRNYGNAPLHDHVQMGTAGALMVQVVVLIVGRVVQGNCNMVTKRPQLLYNEHGELLDFPMEQIQQRQPQQQQQQQDYIVASDDRPTTPRPAQSSTGDMATRFATIDRIEGAMSGFIRSLESAQSVSPTTPVVALFQDTNEQQQIDSKTVAERESGMVKGSGGTRRRQTLTTYWKRICY